MDQTDGSLTRRRLLAGLSTVVGVGGGAGCSALGPGEPASTTATSRASSTATATVRPGDATPAPGRELFVAPDGGDDADGSEADPFGTLEAARDAVRELLADGPPAGGVTVTLQDGRYRRERPFDLGSRDSGTEDAPVVYRARPGGSAALHGGVELPTAAFQPVSGDARERLRPRAREAVLEFDLAAHGIGGLGGVRKRGFGLPSVTPAPELFVDGEPWRLARWPDHGWVRTGSVLDEGGVPRRGGDPDDGAAFEYTHDDRPAEWAAPGEVWLFGYWQYDWADGTLRVADVDTDAGTVETAGASFYGVAEDRRYYYYNVLEELDRPGEFYVDRDGGVLYLYPPESFPDVRVELSLLPGPLVRIDGTEQLRLRGLTLETGRGGGVEATGARGIAIEGCTVRKLGGRGVALTGTRDSEVADCRIDHVGTGGVVLDGGHRPSLTPGGNDAVNNRISRFSRIERTYAPAVALRGVGNRAAHNRLFDAPHMAVSFDGNDHRIEYNEIDHVARETSDAGAIYNGRDWTHRGTVVRHNFLHHIRNDLGGVGQIGIYLDDALPGTRVYGNLLYRVDRAMLIGGGRNNEVVNNLIVECRRGLRFDARTAPGNWAHDNCADGGWTLRDRLAKMPYREEPWASAYPDLVDILDDDPCLPKYNVVERNAFLGSPGTMLDVAPPVEEHGTVANNLVRWDEDGVTYENGTPTLDADNAAAERIDGWTPLPVEEMGVVADTDRERVSGPGPTG